MCLETKIKCAESGWHKVRYVGGKLSIEKCEHPCCQEMRETIFTFLSGGDEQGWYGLDPTTDQQSLSEIPRKLHQIIKLARQKRRSRRRFRATQYRIRIQETWRAKHGFSKEEAIRQTRMRAFFRYKNSMKSVEESIRKAALREMRAPEAMNFWYEGPRPERKGW